VGRASQRVAQTGVRYDRRVKSVSGLHTGVALGAGEAAVVVRDVQATVARALERAEDAGTGHGTAQTDIKESLEEGKSW
jgi:hypothetical protein